MANLHLSYTRRDRSFVENVHSELKRLGHALHAIAPDGPVRTAVTAGLDNWEHFVLVLTKAAVESEFVRSELALAVQRSRETARPQMIYVVLERSVRDLVESTPDTVWVDVGSDVSAVADAISRAAANYELKLSSKRLEKGYTEYVENEIQIQTRAERKQRIAGGTWHAFGFVALFCAIAFVWWSLLNAGEIGSVSIGHAILTLLKTTLVVVLLGACSRYAFALGKAHVEEAIKCGDRVHAISFGRLYVQIAGDSANWPDLRDALRNWNTQTQSGSSSLNPEHADPKLIDAAFSILRLAGVKASDRS